MMKRLLCGALIMAALLGILPANALAENVEEIAADSAAAYVTQTAGDYKAWSTSDERWKDLTLGTTTNTVKSSGSTVVAFTKMVIQSQLKNEEDFTVADCVNLLNSTSKAFSGAQLAWGAASKAIPGLTYSTNKDLSKYTAEAVEAEILKQVQAGYHIVLQSIKSHYVTVDRSKTLTESKVYILDSLADTSLNTNMPLSDSGYTINHIYLFTAAEHLYQVSETVDPTCTQAGYVKTVCSICGDVQNETIAALGHSFESKVIAPTFTEQGYTLHTCTRCGYAYGSDYTDHLPTHADGWAQENDSWYYYKENVHATDWIKYQGKWYYLGSDGAMKTGWVMDGNTWYYLNGDGTMATGWKYLGGHWYYLNKNGAMVTGWKSAGGHWYYLCSSGEMATGWKQISGVWYYFKSSGEMVTGWQKISNTWYYLNSAGVMQTGWTEWNGSRYYLASSGALVTGWAKVSGSWYYLDLNADGAMVTGWKTIGGKTYFFRSDGVLKTKSWGKSGGNYYYFNNDGVMVTGTYVINGETYHFTDSGVCTDYKG